MAEATLKRQLQQNNNKEQKININILLHSNNEAPGQKKSAAATHGKKKIFLFIETDVSVPGMK